MMKIEIADSLYEPYRRLLRQRYHTEDVSAYVEGLIHRELSKYCAPGYELDRLTGAHSRFQLERDLKRALFGQGWSDRSVFSNRYLCLDIDHFKGYLEAHGMTAGDEVLLEIAGQLRRIYPKANIYRFGGDEFVVELGEQSFVPLQLDHQVKLKYSILDVVAHRNERSHHAHRAIMFYLETGIVEATLQVTNIEFKCPNDI